MLESRISKNICTYCGIHLIETNSTRDHIPPKNLFTTRERSLFRAIVVPACKECNNGSSIQDENAKHYLNLCVAQMQRETTEQTELHRKTLQKNARLRQTLKNSKPILAQDTITGIYSFEQIMPIDKIYITDTESVIRRIARGLYWYHFQKILNADKYIVKLLAGFNLIEYTKVTSEARHKKLKHILDLADFCKRVDLLPDIFTYWIGKAHDHKYASAFFMLYRKAVLISVFAV